MKMDEIVFSFFDRKQIPKPPYEITSADNSNPIFLQFGCSR